MRTNTSEHQPVLADRISTESPVLGALKASNGMLHSTRKLVFASGSTRPEPAGDQPHQRVQPGHPLSKIIMG